MMEKKKATYDQFFVIFHEIYVKVKGELEEEVEEEFTKLREEDLFRTCFKNNVPTREYEEII